MILCTIQPVFPPIVCHINNQPATAGTAPIPPASLQSPLCRDRRPTIAGSSSPPSSPRGDQPDRDSRRHQGQKPRAQRGVPIVSGFRQEEDKMARTLTLYTWLRMQRGQQRKSLHLAPPQREGHLPPTYTASYRTQTHRNRVVINWSSNASFSKRSAVSISRENDWMHRDG